MKLPNSHWRGNEQAHAIKPNLYELHSLHDDVGGLWDGWRYEAVEQSSHTRLPPEADEHGHCTKHSTEELLMGQVEERVHSPASPLIVRKGRIVTVRAGAVPNQQSQPKDECGSPTNPQSIVIAHMCLELKLTHSLLFRC